MSASPEPLPHAADANQARASDPSASAWVSANAGTGKTEVLVRRVLRLLLAGSEPQRILCLTYTKMAAAEMQNRLLKELAAWATMEDGTLRERLASLLGRAPGDAEAKAARRLFAQTLEAKGGLKIYTIHGFCERLLQRFPLEAEVTPHFAVLDEAEAVRLKGAAFDAVMARAAADRDGPLGQALAKIVAVTVEDYFRKIVDTVLGRRGDLARMMALHEGDPDWTRCEERCLKRLFGLDEEVSEAELTDAACRCAREQRHRRAARRARSQRRGVPHGPRAERRLAGCKGCERRGKGRRVEADFSHRQAHAAPIRVQQDVAAGGASALRRSRYRPRPLRQARDPTRAACLRRGERGGASARRYDPSRI